MTYVLHCPGGAAEEKLLVSALQAVKRGRIDTVGEIHPKRAQRSPVANSEARRVHHVIEIGQVLLMRAKRDTVQSGIDIPQVMEQDAADVVANQRETYFGAVEQQGIAAQRKAGIRIARAGLVHGKTAHIRFAAAEEARAAECIRY